MSHMIYDPDTGTVLSAQGALLVDTEQLEAFVGIDADVALSEEDPDAQSAAREIGRPIPVPRAPLDQTGPGPLHLTVDRDLLTSRLEDTLSDIDQFVDMTRNPSVNEIIYTGINHTMFASTLPCVSDGITDVELSADFLALPDNHLNPEAGIMITAWFSDEFGRMLTAQAVYYPPIDFEDDMADVMSNSDIITSITSAISSAVTTINHNTARDFDFLLRAL